MMKDGTNIEQRHIILVNFPFSDLSSSKKRPALVISNSMFNKRSEDVVCCLITSNIKDRDNSIDIANKDMETGYLEFNSKIKTYRIFTVNKNIIYRVLGKLNKEKSKLVETEIKKLMEIF
ncbi:MAG: type II toxin-antitoxin system PemK/MazF family toxin [Candidatus Aenigmarchaeota archaeon]|nr:type II toxin-antitoxin system PemK/MazF family toxin [Candidatus Aenigmarchaeota archaeon]